jgi:hypothetical protein
MLGERAALGSFRGKAGRFFFAGDTVSLAFVPCRTQSIYNPNLCQWCVYVDFKTATNILGLPAPELAKEFGLQPQTIRQMRLSPGAASYRTPPAGWEQVVARLARERERELAVLVEALLGR